MHYTLYYTFKCTHKIRICSHVSLEVQVKSARTSLWSWCNGLGSKCNECNQFWVAWFYITLYWIPISRISVHSIPHQIEDVRADYCPIVKNTESQFRFKNIRITQSRNTFGLRITPTACHVIQNVSYWGK